jgi:phosphoesterase RecJ-like protein
VTGGETDAAGIAAILANARSVLLGSHRNPDGDSVGSVLGLAHVLRSRGVEVACLFPQGVPEAYRFLAGADTAVERIDPHARFDLAVVLDTGDPALLHPNWPPRDAYGRLLVVDHHPMRTHFGDHVFRRDTAACVGEMVLEVTDALGFSLDKPLAEAVYVALATDTGFFRYSSVTEGTFRLAARLVAAGVSPWKIAYRAEENFPPARLKLLAEVLGTLRMAAGGAVAAIVVRPGLLERLGLGAEHLENMVNFARGIRGVEVAAQFRVNDEGRVRVSFRSRGRVDVAVLARAFGGGGHHAAAGATLDDPLDVAIDRVLAEAAAAVMALEPLESDEDDFFLENG